MSLDVSLLCWVNSHTSELLDPLMRILTLFGTLYVGAAVCLVVLISRGAGAFVFAGLGLALTVALYEIIKRLVGRARPYEVIGGITLLALPPANASFPSGHASVSMYVALLMAWLFPRYWWMFLLVASGTAFSRVYMGLHYPSDVLCGMVLGAFVFLLVRPLL
ncbi:MAG: phosphatase PAP2 family protein [Methermicoccaceae archaeon]